MMRSLLFLTALFAVVALASADPAIFASISVSPAAADHPISTLTVTYFNKDSEDAYLLNWGTPFEVDGIVRNSFLHGHLVDDESVLIQYRGPRGKRNHPLFPRDYVLVPAHSSASVTIDASLDFAFPVQGTYRVFLHHTTQTKTGEHVLIQSAPIEIHSPSWPGRRIAVEPRPLSAQVNYKECDSSQTSDVKSAISGATTGSKQVRDYLQGCPSTKNSDSTYTRWFGSFSTSRNKTAVDHFNAIYDRLHSNDFAVDCSGEGCGFGVFAYVYPFDPTFTIHVCGSFWRAGLDRGSCDSKPGTLTHETSHFNAVAGTDDIQYGTSGAQSLASSNPNQALNNADNHEYMQEAEPSCGVSWSICHN